MQKQGITDEEGINSRHRSEKKEMQATITRMKHSIGKADRRKRNEINAKIAQMENDLKIKHQNELQLENESADGIEHHHEVVNSNSKDRLSKAQKRRNKKEEKARNNEKAAEEDYQNAQFELQNVESESFSILFAEMKPKLQVYQVPADGNCLYNAIAHQIGRFGTAMNAADLRKLASEHMRYRKDVFLPFLCIDEADFSAYCDKIKGSENAIDNTWGGLPEIRALSDALQTPIHIVQVDSVNIIGEQYIPEPIVITYHRHLYQLGEHYNSTCPLK